MHLCLVQAVRYYCKKADKILKNLGFVGGNVDPCLYVNKSAKGIVYVALYVDDKLMVGNIAALKESKLLLKIMTEL